GASARKAIVFGPGVGRENMQEEVTALVERIGADAWAAPLISRDGVSQDHPRFAGFLPAAPGPLAEQLAGYDCVLVLGGPAFLLHVADGLHAVEHMPPIFQITDDATSAVASPFARSVIGSLALAVPALIRQLDRKSPPPSAARAVPTVPSAKSLTAELAMHVIARIAPDDAAIVEEAPSHKSAMQRHLPVGPNQRFYAMASGGLGFGFSAAVGIALAQPERRVITIIGDGSAMYSFQGLWTAVQERLPVTYVVLNNGGYGAMRAFSRMMQIRNVPGIEVSGIDFVQLAGALGCPARRVDDPVDLESALREAITADGPALVEIAVGSEIASLYESRPG
ncbi:thiamine pyrophosphate-dependent enzyme, partial [Rhizobiaceae sp. 2RAB30]